jgi:hypothetical protein
MPAFVINKRPTKKLGAIVLAKVKDYLLKQKKTPNGV